MLHVCRDFLSIGNPINLSCSRLLQYYLAIFMRTVLGYATVGQTNFNIDGATLRVGTGALGSINQGAGNEYAFSPNGYVVSSSDIGRILAVRSTSNPMVNSGLFRVTGIDTGNNWLFINYRSGDLPPAETGLTWALYASETVFNGILNFNGNGTAGTYEGQGSATQSRIILQSPSALAWQVRICFENSYDRSAGVATDSTIAPGFGGNLAGDFPVAGQHLHGPLYFNVHDSTYYGTTCGFYPGGANQVRVYLWGDDSTGSVFGASRSVVNGIDAMIHFGLPENEELPLPPRSAQRLFVIGANTTTNTNSITWTTQVSTGGTPGSGRGGMSFGLCNQPVSCTYSLYNRLVASGYSSTAARSLSTAGDNPYLAATELVSVDLMAGTILNYANAAGTNAMVLQLEGRRMGQAPIARQGRANYGYFQVATAGQQLWLHLNDGVYLPWQGSILP